MGDLEDYPFVFDLVAQMKGKNRTAGWDVMVSYEIDAVNSFLTRAWANRHNSTQPLESFDVKRYEKHHHQKCLHSITTWNVSLKPPKVQFESDYAVLEMDVTGDVSVQYYKGGPGQEAKDGDPEAEPLSDGWVLTVKTTISSVTASEGGQIYDHQPKGSVLDFSSDPSHKGHIVFDCALSDDYTVTFNWTKSNDPKETPPDDNLKQAKRWIEKHIDAIDFSLASIIRREGSSETYLTPEQMVFQLYHPPDSHRSSLSVGCLSIYIKTKQTGADHGPGDRVPSFSGTEGNIYPIAGGYTGSIIISNWYYLWFETYIDVDIMHRIECIAQNVFPLDGEWLPDNPERNTSTRDDILIVGQLHGYRG
ncbi:hypothetical protein EYB26_002677 [Talaromyces marneffei]|uniref:uncharacterized protein n=1 Tax=Talaromyces marneffei TaxID=37727 RepID=UPI0012A905E4|nr:uncharacterized protein EYB26_002677 [Talaromyces marneffei]QGA15021.1 hypothetical protein EYB26_002677 [Talaromyces marneffei]